MTGVSDERLRALYAPIAERVPGTRANCPAPERILALVQRQGSEDERLAVLDHVMACAACRKDFDLLRAIGRAESGSQSASSARTVRSTRPWMWGVTALAASVLVGFGITQYKGTNASADITRAGSDSAAISLVTPPASSATVHLDGDSIAFTWHPRDNAGPYTVEILDSTGAIAFTTVTQDTTMVMANALQRLRTNASYRWWVRSTAISGESLRSELRPLRVE